MDGLNHPSFIEIGHFAFNAIFNLVYTQSVKSYEIVTTYYIFWAEVNK